jgi:hypothetical protein
MYALYYTAATTTHNLLWRGGLFVICPPDVIASRGRFSSLLVSPCHWSKGILQQTTIYIYLCPHIIAFYYIIIAFKAFNFFFFLFARGLRPSCGAAMCNNTRSSSIHSAGYRLRFMYMSGREEKKGKKKEKKNKGVSDWWRGNSQRPPPVCAVQHQKVSSWLERGGRDK